MTYFFYIVVTIFTVVFLALYSKATRSNIPYRNSMRVIFLSLSFLMLFIPLIMRDVSVGVDYANYRDTFFHIINNTVIDSSVVAWLGWPFIHFTKFVAPLAFNNYIIFYGIISFMSLGFLYGAILKSKIPWLSLFIFIAFCLYFQMFNQIRQLFAICIILYSLKYIVNREMMKFVLIIGFASIFHISAAFFLPFYFLSKIKINKKILINYLIVGVTVCLAFSTIMKIIALTPYGQTYLASGYDMQFSLSTILNFAVRIVLLLVCLIMAKKVLKDESNKFLYNLVICCTILQALTMFSALFGRITTMFFVFYVLLIPEVISANFKVYSRKVIVVLSIIILSIYQYVYYSSDNGAISAGYNNYKVMSLDEGEKL